MKFIEAIKLLYNFFDIKETKKNHTYFIHQIANHCVPDDIELELQTYGPEVITQIWNNKMPINENDAVKMKRWWADDGLKNYLVGHLPYEEERELFQALKQEGYRGEEEPDGMVAFCNTLLFESVVERLPMASFPGTAIIVERLDKILNELKSLPAPTSIEVPDEETDDEMIYLGELYKAYSDEEGCEITRENINNYEEYEDDLSERRIHYFAAESIRRSLEELAVDDLDGQFEILKKETLSGVKDTWRMRHDSGYQCMLAVMEKAVDIQVTNYILRDTPNWISNDIRKGVCHFLVKEGKLYWVRKRG